MFLSVFQIYFIFILGLLSPGQDLLLVLSVSAKSGRASGCFAAAGIASGIAFWIGLSVFIIESLSDRYLVVIMIGKLCLACGLVYIGSKTISTNLRSHYSVSNNKRLRFNFNPYFLGIVINLTNPKAAVFVVGLSSVLEASLGSSFLLILALSGIPVLTLAWFIVVAFFFSSRFLSSIINENQRKINILWGISILLLGILLIISIGIS